MNVLCNKQKLSFPESRFNEETGRNEYTGDGTVTVTPKPNIQTIPDWVRDTNTFKEAVKAGRIFELTVVAPAQIAAPATEEKTEQTKAA